MKSKVSVYEGKDALRESIVDISLAFFCTGVLILPTYGVS